MPKTGILKRVGGKFLKMKKIIFLVVGMSFLLLGNSQTSTALPSSVTILGGDAASDYSSLLVQIGEIEKSIFNEGKKFYTLNEISTFSNSVVNNGRISETQVNYSNEVYGNMIQNNGGYKKCLDNSSLSDNFKSIVNSVMYQISVMEDGTEINTILYPVASNINNNNLSFDEREKLKTFIVAMNANFTVIVNSNYFISQRDKNIESVQGRRGFWGSLWSAIKCAAGTAGSAVLGGVAGAGVGTVTLPVIGTVSGTAVGFWGGASVGIASFC